MNVLQSMKSKHVNYKQLSGFIFHTLKGFPGWSKCNLQVLDVARILNVRCRKRMFMVCDRDKPYTLEVHYLHPLVEIYTPCYSRTITDSIITKRYKTIGDAQKEMKEIRTKLDRVLELDTHILDKWHI